MPQKEFQVEGIGKVTVSKRRSNRSLRLTLSAGGVRVSIPSWTPYSTGLSFVQSKRQWILTNTPQADQLLCHGQMIGRSRRLSLIFDPDISGTRTSVRSNEVVVWYGPGYTVADQEVQHAAELACYRALKTEAVALLTPRLNQLAASYAFAYRSLNFKRLTGRWGSCDQRTNIVLNIFLVQLPWDCIDYVILHELTHTRVLHHGPDFWQALERVLPGGRSFKRTMRAYRPSLQSNANSVA